MRYSVRSFLEKELAPYANDIDRQNDFPQMRVSGERGRGELKQMHTGSLAIVTSLIR